MKKIVKRLFSSIKKYPILLASVIIGVLFFNLSNNYAHRFDEVNQYYENGMAINLESSTDEDYVERLANVLHRNNYVGTQEDAYFAAQQLGDKLKKNGPLPTLYDLKKRRWQLPARLIDSIGTPGYKTLLENTQQRKGLLGVQSGDSLFRDSIGEGQGKFIARVVEVQGEGFFATKLPCKDVVVCLSLHTLDSLNCPNEKVIAYARTDADGKVVFSGLADSSSYSALPIQKYYEYGSPKGVIGGEWDKSLVVNRTFSQQEHRIRLFDNNTLRQIKEDHTLTVRSPQAFQHTVFVYLIAFFVAWWGLYIFFGRKRSGSKEFIAILMLLTGFCLLMMFSINDPLADELYGVEMGQGIVAGVVVIGLLQRVNFVKLYQDRSWINFDIPLSLLRWVFLPYRQKVLYLTRTLSKKRANFLLKCLALLGVVVCLPWLLVDVVLRGRVQEKIQRFFQRLPKGSGYLLLALFLTALLWTPLGSEVGGMKVNLNVGIKFQPSEIAKYLIVFFMAAFFCLHADKIVRYSAQGNAGLFGHKLKMLTGILSGLGALMALYMVLGDMGPALVLAFTFIILYSIIKSKIELTGASEKIQLWRILTCDLAMLIYGVVSFLIFLFVGYRFGYMGVGCIAWFVSWIALGLMRRQVFESAIFFNFIIAAFIFGSSLLGGPLSGVAERLDSRNEMCTNTWGTLPINGAVADAGENTQVAEGLWGLASGGFWGQGLGNGSPYFIPAFHTDMILESIGEQLGFIAILAIIFLLALLLRKTILAGYKSAHPFAFYCCLGIAIVTAVQFVIISLGSMGIIPLTGVTVPFFSYGRVSMILNLMAFGVVFSILRRSAAESDAAESQVAKLKRENIGRYNYSVSILSWMYGLLAVVILSSFFYYQTIVRDEILIRPVYVNNVDGAPVVEYNPRINQLANKMLVGDIYDRTGVLIATSNRSKLSQQEHKDAYTGVFGDSVVCDTTKIQRRYYPFGNHLFFMLGDYNNQLFFNAEGVRGYFAESEHLADLRGYDNRLYKKDSIPVKITLTSEEYTPGRFYGKQFYQTEYPIQLRDYSALLPYLKAGMNSDAVEAMSVDKDIWNIGSVKPSNIQLTIDARLQTRLQQSIADFMSNNPEYANNPKWNKTRISVVILDAKRGDLLASANYPLPNYDSLRHVPNIYNDKDKDISWKAYTDMDLGISYFTAPGSTAKVMTSLAALRKDLSFANEKYIIYKEEIISTKTEPYKDDKWGHTYINMSEALRHSSNCYFIKLVNDKELYSDLAEVYGQVGVRMGVHENNNLKIYPSYSYFYTAPTMDWKSHITAVEDRCVAAYDKYVADSVPSQMNKNNKPVEWSWAWGQNDVEATPMTMARAISIVANEGKMPRTHYLLVDSETPILEERVISADAAHVLTDFLEFTAKEHDKFTDDRVGGKTGTPERVGDEFSYNTKTQQWDVKRTDHYNDGWFICYIKDASIPYKEWNTNELKIDSSTLAVAVRMERTPDGSGSGTALNVTKQVVIKVLETLNYVEDIKFK